MEIKRYLLDKKVRPSNKGFDYLVRAIELCNKDKKYLKNIVTVLYKKIADEFGDTPLRVERAIRYAIENSTMNLTNKEFIAYAILEIE